MSTPFPLEEQAQLDPARPAWNPWNGPADPHWYSGMGFGDDTAHLGPFYQLGTGIGSGAEKGAALLTGLYGREASTLADVTQTLHIPGSAWLREQSQELGDVGTTARDNAKRLTPDPATTGTAAQTLNGLASGVTRYVLGSVAAGPIGGAAAVGSTEAMSRYQDLREQGVDEETARASAGLAGIAGAAGAFVPGGWGSTLASRLASGAAANVGFGVANRYLDHKILEDGGYHEMADQQRALDSTQLLTDTVLGMGFGGLAHLHAGAEEARVKAIPTWTPTPREVPGVEDAALTANLALRDRAAAPGVAVDPAAANAHSAAMEKATADLLQGNAVDVSGTGVDRGDFLHRPAPDTTEPENMLVNVLKESGILDEERNLQQLEAAMGRRLRGEREPEPVQTPAQSGRPVDVDSLTDPDQPVTLYRGEDKGNVHGGEWWTTDRAQAEKFGQVREVILPAGVVARNSVRGHGGPHERVFPTEGRRPPDLAGAESVTSEAPLAEEGYTVGEQELTDEQRQAFERLSHPADQVLQEDVGGGGETGERGTQDDGGRGGLGESRGPTRVYRGGRGGALTPEHFESATLGRATGHPSSGLGVYFTNDAADAARYGSVTEHDLTLQNPKRIPIEDLPGFNTPAEATAYREKLRAEGHDGIVLDSSHRGGPKHYVAFDQNDVRPVAPDPLTQTLAEHPGMQIPDEDGNTTSAADQLHQADTAAAQGEQEAPKATEAAINCFLRKGG